jgi:Zn ribbon nucleic-acid-binding protein
LYAIAYYDYKLKIKMEYKSETKNCQNCKKDFIIEPDDFSFYEKMKVPPPTFCPECRMQRRWAFRNERGLYKRKCDFSGKEIFSMYAPDSPVKVFERDIWLSDAWDPMDYGREINWSKPFLTQVYGLMLDVPFKSNNVIRGVNSDYSNNATDPKNSYLVFNTTGAEDSMYSNGLNFARDCVDVSHVSKVESCYQSFWLESCYRTHYSSQCVDSSDLWFCRDCQGCMNCFGCVNLRNKNYFFFNQKYTKDEYNEKIKIYNLNIRQDIEKALSDTHSFWKKFPNKNHQGVKNVNCTGSYVTNSKNVKDSFLIRESENIKYCQYIQETPGSKDCYDYSNWGDGADLVYEAISCGSGVNNIKFAFITQESTHNTEYTMACKNSADCFGCVGLKKKQYCILNKQYTKEEYVTLVEKIKKHMNDMPYIDKIGRIYKYGEFFPSEFSPWAYNETIAQEYFPLTKEEALTKGFRWRDPDVKNYEPTILASGLPSDIKNTNDSITKEIIECAHRQECNHNCTKAFRIIPDELQFYRKIGVPVPVLCPACRTMERLKMRLGIKLYEEECMCAGKKSKDEIYENLGTHIHGDEKCSNKFKTGFDPKKGDIIYCDSCYKQEVY